MSASRVISLRKGRVREEGAPGDLLADPTGELAAFLSG